MDNFIVLPQHNGEVHSLIHTPFPARIFYCQYATSSYFAKEGSYFGYVLEGTVHLTAASSCFSLKQGMYFSIPQEVAIDASEGSVLLVEQLHYRSLLAIGGPVEPKGRLQYIDGCTDTLLLSPTLLGDPCLNVLHIPAGTFQSQHTHPSFRIGVIVKGRGECVTPDGRQLLFPGLCFVIPEGAKHSFQTTEEDLLVVAYHPDSDFGPTHENHPMINRTYLSQEKSMPA